MVSGIVINGKATVRSEFLSNKEKKASEIDRSIKHSGSEAYQIANYFAIMRPRTVSRVGVAM